MDRTMVIHARIEPQLKQAAESIFHNIGLTTTDAIRLFFRQVEIHHGLPFDLKAPNKESMKALKEARSGKKLTKHKTIKSFRKTLEEL